MMQTNPSWVLANRIYHTQQIIKPYDADERGIFKQSHKVTYDIWDHVF